MADLLTASFNQRSVSLPVGQVVTLLNASPNRVYLAIQNNSATTVYVGLGISPSALSGIAIFPGGYFELVTPAPDNQVQCVSPLGAGQIVMVDASRALRDTLRGYAG